MERKLYMREYAKRNREKILAIKYKYNSTHREKNNQSGKDYRRRMAKGKKSDSTWNGTMHVCCNAKSPTYHRVSCILNSDDLSDLK